MSNFAADRSSMLDKLSNYTAVMRQRKDALMAIQSISTELLDVLAAGDYENLNEILNKRDKAFKLLTQTASGGSDLREVIEHVRRSPAEASEQSAAVLCAMDQDVHAILADVVEKQKRCEDLLKSQIENTSDEIRQSSKRRQLNSIYGPANVRPEARFLDRMR